MVCTSLFNPRFQTFDSLFNSIECPRESGDDVRLHTKNAHICGDIEKRRRRKIAKNIRMLQAAQYGSSRDVSVIK